ncbi:MAG: hypothetical protein NTZ97_01940 [Candidatus Moranbacteria bacterium]|nr:hypothetical protein [Candidatus Moranbacteria bacterium]
MDFNLISNQEVKKSLASRLLGFLFSEMSKATLILIMGVVFLIAIGIFWQTSNADRRLKQFANEWQKESAGLSENTPAETENQVAEMENPNTGTVAGITDSNNNSNNNSNNKTNNNKTSNNANNNSSNLSGTYTESQLGSFIADAIQGTTANTANTGTTATTNTTATGTKIPIDADSLQKATIGISAGNIPVLNFKAKLDFQIIPKITKLGYVTEGIWKAKRIGNTKLDKELEDKTYNGLELDKNSNGFTVTGGNGIQLIIEGHNVSINQSLLTTDSPTFAGLTATNFNLTTLDLGTNTITDGVMSGDWDFGTGTLTTSGALAVGSISAGGN